MKTTRITLGLTALATLALSACSTTQQSQVNKAASTIASGAGKLQADVATYGPTIVATAASLSGTGAKAQSVATQVSAVTADASAYAADAQTLAQIVAALTAPSPAPVTTGS